MVGDKPFIPELPYPAGLPEEVVDALDVFRFRKQPFTVFIDEDTHEVIGCGDLLNGRMTLFADRVLAEAGEVIANHYQAELKYFEKSTGIEERRLRKDTQDSYAVYDQYLRDVMADDMIFAARYSNEGLARWQEQLYRDKK